jgi:hypothetical protein
MTRATAPCTRRRIEGVLITVTARQNERGAWLTDISAALDGQPLTLRTAQPLTPEWLTQAEALRAGVARGRFLVDRSMASADSPNPSGNRERSQ